MLVLNSIVWKFDRIKSNVPGAVSKPKRIRGVSAFFPVTFKAAIRRISNNTFHYCNNCAVTAYRFACASGITHQDHQKYWHFGGSCTRDGLIANTLKYYRKRHGNFRARSRLCIQWKRRRIKINVTRINIFMETALIVISMGSDPY